MSSQVANVSTSHGTAAGIVGAELTGGLSGWSTTASLDLGVSEMNVVDGPMGIVSRSMDERELSLLMPSGTAIGATWNPEIAAEIGELIGQQAVERDVAAVMGPNLNLPRTPLTGRGFEMFSEDPFMTGVLGAAWIRGVQSQGVASCAKHVVANDTETERRWMNSKVSEKSLREVYLRPFEIAAAQATPWMMMMAYNRVNGTHCSSHGGLISILKKDWQFDGVVVSDWYAVDGTLQAASAGLDLEMPGPSQYLGPKFAQAVLNGQLPPERLQDAIDRMVLLAKRTGRIAGTDKPVPAIIRDTKQSAAVLAKAAAASFVLLENRDHTLPLDARTLKVVTVTGENSTKPCFQGGTFATVRPMGEVITPLEAIRAALGPGVEVLHTPGTLQSTALPLTELKSTAPGGAPGALLEIFGAEGSEPVHREVRHATSFVWFGPVPGLGAHKPGRARITTRLCPETSGIWTFGGGGTGQTVLLKDGVELLAVPAPAVKDVMGSVARADTSPVQCYLDAGVEVEIVVETRFEPGRVQAVTANALPEQSANPLDEAITLARQSDAVIVVVGDEQSSSRESADRATAGLSPSADKLVKTMTQTNAKTVVVVNASRAVLMPWADDAAAIVMAWFPGQEFGPAIASVLTGKSEPSGRLPVTFPFSDNDIPGFGTGLDGDFTLDYDATEPTGYRHHQQSGPAPRYHFGFGLGYTTFSLETAGVGTDTGQPVVHALITNQGTVAGRDVVQVYGRAPDETNDRLMGFAAAMLAPGESAEVAVPIGSAEFRRWDEAVNDWFTPTGQWTLRVARHAGDPGRVCKIKL